MDSLDKLLAQLKVEYDPLASTPQQLKPDVLSPYISPQPKSQSIIDSILAEVKADVEAQEAVEKLQRQQELEQARIQQETIKAQQLKVLQAQAQEWLEKLDPFSPEGLWFERFAEGYPSKLAAAVEYLQYNK